MQFRLRTLLRSIREAYLWAFIGLLFFLAAWGALAGCFFYAAVHTVAGCLFIAVNRSNT